MLSIHHIFDTIDMIDKRHLDIRTITMGISLLDCVSEDPKRCCEKIYDKICRHAERLVSTGEQIELEFGIPIVNKRISVSPIGTVCAAFTRDQMVKACQVLDSAAKDVGVDFLGGFGALVEKGMTPGERNLIDSLPEALTTTDRICSSINVGSTRSGINMDAVSLMGERIVDVAQASADTTGVGYAKQVVF